MKVLIAGATGTLGRQIVRRALDEGHEVVAYIRNREKAQFLETWGATLFLGDFRDLSNLPAALEGVDAVVTTVTSGTGQKDNTLQEVDDQGNRRFIDGCKVAGVKLFIFTSILNCDQFPQVNVMKVKADIEKYLVASGLPYVIFRPGAFMQGLVSQYAVPVLEKNAIQVMGESSPIAYISTLDAARFYSRALISPEVWGQTYALAGPRYWTAYEIVDLCDELSGVEQKPRLSRMPLSLMRLIPKALRYFKPLRHAADFFEFAEVFASGKDFGADMTATCQQFQMTVPELMDVEPFLTSFYLKIKQKLREKNYKEPKLKLPF
jgi:uncharacterized protein YbjT (DUF2867 family)